MQLSAVQLSAEIRRCQRQFGDFQYHISKQMVAYNWQGMTSYECSTVTLGLGGNVVELPGISR